MEIATMDARDPEWNDYDYTQWFSDKDPVPALQEPVDDRRG
jgi:hypothetical protein